MRVGRFLRLFVGSFGSMYVVACGGGSSASSSPATPAAAASGAPALAEARAEKPKDEAPPAEPAKEEPKPAEARASLPVVRVLEAGSAPRRALRYKFKAGVTEYAEFDMKMAMAMSMGDKSAPRVDLPTVRMLLRIDAKEVTPEGDLRLAFSSEKVDILKDTQPDPKLRGALEKELGGIIGMHGSSRISPRGVATELEFELPQTASPQMKSHLDSLRDAMRTMYVPLPEEEVGKGAKWEVTSRVPLTTALMDTKLVYTLRKLESDSANADVESTFSAEPNQPMRPASLPPGATATLESLSGHGTGTVTPSFVKLVGPAQNKLAMETVIAVAAQNEKMRVKMATEVSVAIRGAKAPPPAKK